jgi:TonB-dependent SusC/RagA subfamily outer membrane receptor
MKQPFTFEVLMTSPRSRVLLALGASLALSTACSSTKQAGKAPSPPRADVTAEDIERAPGQTIEEILKGRVSGVTVAQGDRGITVRIRGFTSFYGSNEPLYVLDGVPFAPGPGGLVTGVDPYDIESIRVLKDPADTALYGMRGANGVIVITTKSTAIVKKPS